MYIYILLNVGNLLKLSSIFIPNFIKNQFDKSSNFYNLRICINIIIHYMYIYVGFGVRFMGV